MPMDFATLSATPARVREETAEGPDGKFKIVEFPDYPRLLYRWDSFRGEAAQREGVAERVTWFCDGVACPDFDTAILRMENETAAEGRERG